MLQVATDEVSRRNYFPKSITDRFSFKERLGYSFSRRRSSSDCEEVQYVDESARIYSRPRVLSIDLRTTSGWDSGGAKRTGNYGTDLNSRASSRFSSFPVGPFGISSTILTVFGHL